MIFIDGNLIEFKSFPNNETLINEQQIRESVSAGVIGFKYETDKDLINLMLLKKYLDNIKIKSSLEIYYMPYSRMDRSENGSDFTLKYIADFINSLNFLNIVIYEPHSDVTPALINNCRTVFPTLYIFSKVKQIINFNEEKDFIYYPDAGSEKRYSKNIGVSNQLVGFKNRDFSTGRIIKLDVFGDVDKKDFKVVMIDDLCSRGGTFQLGAEKLKNLGASEIYLIAGHCENTIYDGDIFKKGLINKVFTTNSIITEELNEKIKIFDIIKNKNEYMRKCSDDYYEKHCV